MRRRRYLVCCGLTAGIAIAGCTGNGDSEEEDDRGNDEIRREAFRNALTGNGITIHELSIDENSHVILEYSPAEPTEESVEDSIDATARAFFDRVYGEEGWAVEQLDARVVVDGTLVATWSMKAEWIEQYLEGRLSREEMAARVEETVERHDQ
jgi:hypothetical protein